MNKKIFQEAAKRGQDNLRNKLGEEAYRERMRKIGKKGGIAKSKKMSSNTFSTD